MGIAKKGSIGIREIRMTILRLEKPFSVADLFIELNATDAERRRLIIQVLNDMYAEGLIVYDKVSGIVSDEVFAFRVAVAS